MSDIGSVTSALHQDDEVLLRMVHPAFVQDGRVTSQVFRPTPKDRHRLSVDRGSLSDAATSWRRFTASGWSACGVMGVTVGECRALDLPAYPDPLPATEEMAANPAHALIDFGDKPSDRAREKAGKALRRVAVERGWLHGPVEGAGR